MAFDPTTIRKTKGAVVWLRLCSSFAWLDMLIAAVAICIATAAGRKFGIDA